MIRSVLSLGFIQIIGYFVPFATLAVVGRLAPPHALSGFLYVQSVAALLAIIVEYGFHLSAVRMAGEAMVAGTERRTYSAIHATKGILLSLAVAIGACVAIFGAQFKVTPDMLLAICMAIFSYGARPLWYFQAKEEYKTLLKTEIVASAVSLVAVMTVAQYLPYPGALAIAWAAPRFIATIILILGVHSSVGYEWVHLPLVMNTLRESFPLFLHKVSASALHLGVPVIMAFLLSQTQLLDFQRAERIFTAVQSLLLVISQASYALIVKQIGNEGGAKRTAHHATFYQVCVSTTVAVLVAFTAPWLVLLFWGGKHSDAIDLLRVYSLGFPLLAMNAAIGLNYLLPSKHDVAVVGAAIAGAIATLTLVYSLTSHFGPQGAILSILSGELVIFIVMIIALLANPFTKKSA